MTMFNCECKPGGVRSHPVTSDVQWDMLRKQIEIDYRDVEDKIKYRIVNKTCRHLNSLLAQGFVKKSETSNMVLLVKESDHETN